MGLLVATLAMALDPQFVVIGGGLMDPQATSAEFRERYLRILWENAELYLWPAQRSRLQIVPAALGDLSQAIGAALVALYRTGREEGNGRPCLQRTAPSGRPTGIAGPEPWPS